MLQITLNCIYPVGGHVGNMVLRNVCVLMRLFNLWWLGKPDPERCGPGLPDDPTGRRPKDSAPITCGDQGRGKVISGCSSVTSWSERGSNKL